MLADRIRRMGAPHWLALFGLIGASWLALALMAVPDDLRASAQVFGADLIAALCVTSADAAGFARLFLMWSLMSAAMMAPTALSMLATYDDLGHSAETRPARLVAGYLTVWFGFSALAAGAQIALFSAGLVSVFGDSRSVLLSSALLAGAGLYQFSALKQACLTRCRQPLPFFVQHWDEGAWRMGLRIGALCLGCCWALMALAFVGGVTSLGFMALATAIMVFEKLQAGAWITAPLGAALIGAAILLPVI